MAAVALPFVYALFLWWFATGCLFLLNMLPTTPRRWSMALTTLFAAGAVVGLIKGGHHVNAAAAYLSFTCGLVLWGWQTMTYYMGYITGPREQACPSDADGWARFGYGLATSLWHELAALMMGIGLVAVCWHLPNRIGLWTYLVLWSMHVSAKLNLFLGVRNTNDEFLPGHLSYLKSFFRRRRMNPLFPLSILCGSFVTALCLDAALAVEADDFTVAGFALVATLSGLAVFEHACLFVPLPAMALWRWRRDQRRRGADDSSTPARHPDGHGHMSAGRAVDAKP